MEKLRYVIKENFEKTQREYNLVVEPSAQTVIDNATQKDILALRIEEHSPPVIKSAEVATMENFRKFLSPL
jgi:hypothetical protein